jgi:putative transcriptional regulator
MSIVKSPRLAIKWKLNQLMFERGIKNAELCRLTGLHSNTISKLKNSREMPERLEKNTLDKLCQALKVQPGDLLVYENDTDKSEEKIR